MAREDRRRKRGARQQHNTSSTTLFEGNSRNLVDVYHNASRNCSFKSGTKNPLDARIQGLGRLVGRVCTRPARHDSAQIEDMIEELRFQVAWCFFARVGVRDYYQGWSNAGHEYQLQVAVRRLESLNRIMAKLKSCARLPLTPSNSLYAMAANRLPKYINKAPAARAPINANIQQRTKANILAAMKQFGYLTADAWKLRYPAKHKNIMREVRFQQVLQRQRR